MSMGAAEKKEAGPWKWMAVELELRPVTVTS
jgi:hypothetical protein